MAETYDKIFRQVALKANLLRSESAGDFDNLYTDANIGLTEMLERASEWPKNAVDDCILAAGDRLIRAIAKNPRSPYRKDFQDVTATLGVGALIPEHSAAALPIVGVIGTVRDAVTNEQCELASSRQQIESYSQITLKTGVHLYWTDNTRIWHTRTANGVVCDVVTWDKQAERTKLAANPTRGDCDFTEDLHEALVNGALSMLMRGTFNDAQVEIWGRHFESSLKEIEAIGVVS